ncbi:FCD domain-containing protein [Streptomyces sparsogenes]|uniref:FadR/GntR family transcriptional regulator n=1 Tax=Streptomyces sparsogenes TaxID=67365 RepID=UPI0033FC58A2
MSQQEREELEAALQEMRDNVDDVKTFYTADHRFHEVILRGSGNRRLADHVSGLRDTATLQGLRTIPRYRDATQVIAEHERIARAIAARAPDGAARAMLRHLLNSAELLVGEKESTSYLEWREWVGGDRCADEH